MSTSLFWFYVQVYCDDHHVKRFELENFPLFDLEKLSAEDLAAVAVLYDEYLTDIERNVKRSNFAEGSVYQQSGAKIYKLVKSKALIDKLDDVLGKFYGLTDAEINFVKNFELEFRLSGA